MKNLKLMSILIVLTLILSYSAIGFAFSKYQSSNRISNINFNATPRPQYEMTGSNHDVIFEKNTQSEITVSMIPSSGINERIYIPVDTLEVGLYQLSFDVYMETEWTGNILVDNTKYMYGCTIGENENLELGDYVYMWKSITPLEQEHVDIAFWATAEDVASGKVTWVWNWGNIRDNYRSRIYLTNIGVEKIPEPTGPYIDFPFTQNIYLEPNENAEYSYKYGSEEDPFEIGYNAYHPAKGTFVRQATYNDFAISIETLGLYETYNIPLKGLTAGKTYKLKFDQKRTPANFWYDTSTFGCYVDSAKYTWTNSVGSNFVCHFYQTDLDKPNNELTFTATADTMYWIWQAGSVIDGQWFNVYLNNCSITQV